MAVSDSLKQVNNFVVIVKKRLKPVNHLFAGIPNRTRYKIEDILLNSPQLKFMPASRYLTAKFLFTFKYPIGSTLDYYLLFLRGLYKQIIVIKYADGNRQQ